MDLREKKITINKEVDIVIARLQAKELTEEVGFSNIEKHCIMTSISELATNIFFYAGKGIITLKIINRKDGNKGMEIVANDKGRGIEDIDTVLQDGYSTHNGLGGGLPGVKRLMSEMEISSTVGKGTLVRAVKWMNEDLFNKPLLPVIEP